MTYCDHCMRKAHLSLLLVLVTAALLAYSQTVEVDDLLIEGPEGNVTAPLGSNLTLTCRGNGTIVWVINGNQLRSSTDNTIDLLAERNVFPDIGVMGFSSLTIIASEVNNMTTYGCRIEAGMVFGGTLRYQREVVSQFINYGLPGAPSDIRVTAQGLYFLVSWEAPFVHRGEELTYQVEGRNQAGSVILTAPDSPFLFNETIGERDCSVYSFTVNSQNAVGLSLGGIVGSLRVPTPPTQLMSSQVSIAVSLDPLSATLTFPPPNPCSTYPVTQYLIAYRAFINSMDSNDTTLASEQARNLPPIQASGGPMDTVVLTTGQNLAADRFVNATITAINSAGMTVSEDILFSTGGVQSASVLINDDYIGTVSCVFSEGATSSGCQVSLAQVDSNGNMTFLFSVNATVAQPTVEGIVFEELPEGSAIVATVIDINNDGSTGTIQTAAFVSGPFSPTTQPPMTTVPETIPTTTPTQASTQPPATPVISEELLYIIVGAGGGGIFLLLVCIIFITCCICCCTRRRKSDYAAVHKPIDDLSNNHAYGGPIQLTGATTTGRLRNNTYIESTENGDHTVSGLGPAYETIEDAKKAAVDAGASLAPNPIYAPVAPPGSQTNLTTAVSHTTLATNGSQANLVDNPVYADTNNKQTNGKPNPYSDVSAMNPIYSGMGNAPPPIPIPTNPRPPGFPYKSESSPLTPSTQASPNVPISPTPPGYSTPINRSQSTDVVPSFNEYAYAEVRGAVQIRTRNAVSTSSEQEKPAPITRNESYGVLVPSPLTTSPPATVPENGSLV